MVQLIYGVFVVGVEHAILNTYLLRVAVWRHSCWNETLDNYNSIMDVKRKILSNAHTHTRARKS